MSEPACLRTDDKHGHSHALAIHDPFGHFTVFGSGNKANVDGEKWSSDTFIHNEVMRYLGDEFKKISGLSFIHEFTDAMFHPIFLKPGADGKVDHERLHPDGILTSGAKKIFIEFSRCPENLASERIKTKVRRLREVAKLHNAGFCVVVLTKHEGKILEEGSISIFDEYGKQSAKTRFTRERSTFDEHYCYEDDVYAKVTTGHCRKTSGAIAHFANSWSSYSPPRPHAGGQKS